MGEEYLVWRLDTRMELVHAAAPRAVYRRARCPHSGNSTLSHDLEVVGTRPSTLPAIHVQYRMQSVYLSAACIHSKFFFLPGSYGPCSLRNAFVSAHSFPSTAVRLVSNHSIIPSLCWGSMEQAMMRQTREFRVKELINANTNIQVQSSLIDLGDCS
jgi:hypothetical protein